MYRQILLAQWGASRPAVLTFVVLAFAAPLAAVYVGTSGAGTDVGQVRGWLAGAERVGALLPMLALFVGVFLGIAAWAPDHLGRHVYALSLPLPRWQFVLLRFAAGATLLAPPIAALGLGAVLASLAVSLPAGIHAYPAHLTVRFALATLLCFSMFFSIAIATRRAVLSVLGLIGGVLLADLIYNTFTGGSFSITAAMFEGLTTWPGPLAILMGRWALFDV
ncbi:MAG: hypothetical protein ACHQX4_09805 [Gemmatimonadales bacterium]